MKTCTEKDKKALIILDSLSFLGYNQKREILSRYAFPSEIFENKEPCFALLDSWEKSDKKGAFEYAFHEEYFAFLTKSYGKVEYVTFLDEKYPERLTCLDDYPLVLYCSGNLDLLNHPETMGIAGSRKTLKVALALCEKVVKECGEKVAFVCGNSEGVESLVLNSCTSGNVVCVLASGFKRIYPEHSRECVLKTARNGLVISEYPPFESAKQYYFARRNRLIAVLSDNLFVVSGSLKSGVRSTVDGALDYGKDVYAIPYGIDEESGTLCNELIKNGAYCVTGIEDFLTKYSIEKTKTQKNFTPLQQKVYDIISEGIKTTDKIIEASGLKSEEVLTALVMLELDGVLIKVGADEYSITRF